MKLNDLRCSTQALGRRGLGLLLILSTAVIWVVASFISELLVSSKPGQRSLHVPPLLLTYLATSVFMAFLPIAYLRMWWEARSGTSRSAVKYQRLDAVVATSDMEEDQPEPHNTQQQQQQQQQHTSLADDLDAAAAQAGSQAVTSERKAAEREAIKAAAQCFLLWFAAQYCFNWSLSWTSVTSNTILSSSSSLFTFALSMIFLKEPYSLAKLLSIALCIGGTILVTLSDHDASSSSSSSGSTANRSIAGDLLCLVSAVFYASYVVTMRRALPDDEEANVALFFGYVGLFCTLLMGPVVGVLAWLGSLDLARIPREAYAVIAVEGVLNYAFSDYLWAHAVLLLGPTIATLGLSVQIPIAAVAEAVWGHPGWLTSTSTITMTVAGTLLIMGGFFWGNLAGSGPVPGSHHRHGQAGEGRRYLDAGDGDWNAAFSTDSDDEAGLLGIPISTNASTRGMAAGTNPPGRGGGRASASLELSPTNHGSKGGGGSGNSVASQQQQQQQQNGGDGSGGSGSGSSGSRSSPEGSPGSAGSRRPYKASRLARASSYLDPL